MAIILRWSPNGYGVKGCNADVNEPGCTGRFVVSRAKYARTWSASFKGELRQSPNSISSERSQNFISSEDDAKKICSEWANGATTAACLAGISAARDAL